MNKRTLAQWLVHLARKLCPEDKTIKYEDTVTYKPMVCGKAYSISKKDVKYYKIDHHENSSRVALRNLTKETLNKAKREVLDTICRQIMEESVYTENGQTIVKVKVNCYIPL